jgi:deoxyhypusine monooxygenase
MWGKAPPLESLQDALADSSKPIGMRMRAAYFLKQEFGKEQHQDLVIASLSKGLKDARHGSLMRHEFAYVMGQLRDERCCQILETILLASDDCVMVRHEAAEALGAIGAARSRPVLEQIIVDNPTLPELSDTCRLALNVFDWRIRGDPDEPPPVACACMLNPYSSTDPAPPHPAHVHKSDQELGDLLNDSSQSLFERYRCMFSLRNRGGALAVLQLGRTLIEDTSSPLLRHEVAYVLGQLQHPDSLEALSESLRRPGEHMMVRHESAEALGAIDGGRWEEVETILQEFAKDPNPVVSESCLVALDAADYWGHATTDTTDTTSTSGMDDISQKQEDAAPLSFGQQKAVTNGKMELPKPNEEARTKILKAHTHKMVVSSKVGFEELARLCEGFNGMQLKAVCVQGNMLALRRGSTEMTHQDFVQAIADVVHVVTTKKREDLLTVVPPVNRQVLAQHFNVQGSSF